jgi:hypothetical protein
MKLWKFFFSKKSFFEFVFTNVVLYIINYIIFSGPPSHLGRWTLLVIPSVLTWILYESISYKERNKITKKIYPLYMAIVIPIMSFLMFWAYVLVLYLTVIP